MLRTKAAIVLFCFFLYSPISFTSTDSPRSFISTGGALLKKGLGYSCLGTSNIEDDLLCNPSLVPLQKEPSFSTTGLISNGYDNLAATRSIISGKMSESSLETLFGENRILQLENAITLTFKSKLVNIQYIPYQLLYMSEVRNPTNPYVDLLAIESQALSLQFGYSILDTFQMGMGLSSLSHKGVNKEFYLLELTTEPGADLLKPQTENVLLAEPALTFSPWSSVRLSLVGKNLGSTPNKLIKYDPHAEMGLTYISDFFSGQAEISLDYRQLNASSKENEKLGLGLLYSYGSMRLAAGVDYYGVSGGILFSIFKLSSGVVFSTNQVPWQDQENYNQTVYTQFGAQL